MKFLFCLSLLLLVTAGCQNSPQSSADQALTEKAFVQELPDENAGFSFASLQKEYPTSAQTLAFTAENAAETKVKSGYGIFIEKKVNGTWYKFPYTEPSFEEMLRYLPPGEAHTFEVAVAELDQALTPGEYRAVHEGVAAPFSVAE